MDDDAPDDLECKVAVKYGKGDSLWKVVGQAGRMSEGKKQPWPMELMRRAKIGDGREHVRTDRHHVRSCCNDVRISRYHVRAG